VSNLESGEATGQSSDVLDLTKEPDLSSLNALTAGAAAGVLPATGPSLKKNRWDDAARVVLAFMLVGLLSFVVILTAVDAVSGNTNNEATIESYLKVVLSPIIGLVGSVVGFYFGAKSQSS
jgi:hypothetical protein